VLRETGLRPSALELDLTEAIVMEDAANFVTRLAALKALGIRLSLDDFGTGYSNLSYLKRFPLDFLKVDRSFVQDVTTSPDDAAIVRAVISLGHSLGLAVVAEGVETEAQVEWLRRERCEQIQGYVFSRPLPAAQFEALLRSRKGLPSRGTGAQDGKTLLIVDDDAGVAASVVRVLRDTGLRPSALELDLTEAIVMEDAANFVTRLAALKALVAELASGQVDGERDRRRTRVVPCDDLRAAGAQDPFAELENHVARFRRIEELARHDEAALRMLPAEQCFAPHDLPGSELDLWLVVQHELAGCQRIAELGAHRNEPLPTARRGRWAHTWNEPCMVLGAACSTATTVAGHPVPGKRIADREEGAA
jgi:EAL domain-containing protein (putative c-di-GMP-specific phosphodiesterase class I)